MCCISRCLIIMRWAHLTLLKVSESLEFGTDLECSFKTITHCSQKVEKSFGNCITKLMAGSPSPVNTPRAPPLLQSMQGSWLACSQTTLIWTALFLSSGATMGWLSMWMHLCRSCVLRLLLLSRAKVRLPKTLSWDEMDLACLFKGKCDHVKPSSANSSNVKVHAVCFPLCFFPPWVLEEEEQFLF